MMYNKYEKKFIGNSDIATLIAVGCDYNTSCLINQLISFGEDGRYTAYIVDELAEIGKHYTNIASFKNWLKIYDDEGLTFECTGYRINVYRASEMGCIIQIIGEGTC